MTEPDDAIVGVFDAAMVAQHRRLAERLASGMPRAGWKICINDRRMQKKLGLDASFVGFLDGSRQLASDGIWKFENRGQAPVFGVEPEIAVHFARGATGDAAAVAHAIDGIAPAIEVVDWSDVKFDLASLAASSSFHAGFVVGELRPLAATPDIGDSCPLFRRGDATIGVPDTGLMPGTVVEIVAAAAAFLARYGQRIEAGDWLLCGACTNPARAEAGDRIEADFGSLGSVRVRFEG